MGFSLTEFQGEVKSHTQKWADAAVRVSVAGEGLAQAAQEWSRAAAVSEHILSEVKMDVVRKRLD